MGTRDINRVQLASTRRETIHGGSTPASLRVMFVANCTRFISLTVNGTAVSYKHENLKTASYNTSLTITVLLITCNLKLFNS
jgi:hypothetical protein